MKKLLLVLLVVVSPGCIVWIGETPYNCEQTGPAAWHCEQVQKAVSR